MASAQNGTSDAQSPSKTLPSVLDLSGDTQLLESSASTNATTVDNVAASTEASHEGVSPTGATVETSVASITTSVVNGFESPGRFGKKAADRRQCHYKGKLVLLGDISVGKTAIVERCEKDSFRRDLKSTIGVAFTQKTIFTKDAVCKFDLWDSAGEERFRSLNTLYFKGAGAGIIVFDVTNRSTFESAVEYWIDHLKAHGVDQMIIALVGNKSDLTASRQVTFKEAQEMAHQKGIAYFETSAKSGRGITEVFDYVANQVPTIVAENEEDSVGFRITQVATPRPGRTKAKERVKSLRLNMSHVESDRGCCT